MVGAPSVWVLLLATCCDLTGARVITTLFPSPSTTPSLSASPLSSSTTPSLPSSTTTSLSPSTTTSLSASITTSFPPSTTTTLPTSTTTTLLPSTTTTLHPSTTTTLPPTTTTTLLPSTTTTLPTSTTTTLPPTTTTALLPSTTTTLLPSTTTTLPPSTTTTLLPSTTTTLPPSTTTTLPPSTTTTLLPSTTTTLLPSTTTSLYPSTTNSLPERLLINNRQTRDVAYSLSPSTTNTLTPSPTTSLAPSTTTTLAPSTTTTLPPSTTTTLPPPTTTTLPPPTTTFSSSTETYYTYSTIPFDHSTMLSNERHKNSAMDNEDPGVPNPSTPPPPSTPLPLEPMKTMTWSVHYDEKKYYYIVSWDPKEFHHCSKVPASYDVEVSCERNHNCCGKCQGKQETVTNTTYKFKAEPHTNYTVKVTADGCKGSRWSGEPQDLKNDTETPCEDMNFTASTNSLQVDWNATCSFIGYLLDNVSVNAIRNGNLDRMFPHHGFPWSRGPRRPDHDFLWPRGFGEWGHNRPLLSQRSKVIEMCASSTTVEELDPFTKYSVAVTYDNGERNCTKNVTTKPTEPSKPKYLQVQQKPDFNDATKQSRLAIITWEAPQPRNGILKKYTFTYQLSNNESSKEHTLSAQAYAYELELKPESSYSFSVTAENEEPAGSQSLPSTLAYTTPAGTPFFTTSEPLKTEKDEVTHYSVTLIVNGTSISNDNGKVRKCEVRMLEGCDEKNIDYGRYSVVYCTKSPQRSNFAIVIGSEKPASSDCAVDPSTLKSSTCYTFYVVIHTSSHDKNSNSVTIATTYDPATLGAWILTGIVVILLIGVIGTYIIYRRRYMPIKRCESIELPLVVSSPPDVNVERRILLSDLPATVQRLFSGGAISLSQEYAYVKALNTSKPCINAKLPVNKSKNRYFNILPFDETRVMLKEYPNTPYSDFINASYIHGYSVAREFIASQGPLRNTVNDFWRMVWEKNVHVIVMVTQCVERNKEKCCKYWPDVYKSFSFDGTTLKVKNLQEQEHSQDGYILRNLQVSKKHKVRLIRQFHFVAWPDMGCPTTPDTLIHFVKTVRKAVPKESSHVVVHCSAGVGRTGTFIGLSNLMEEMSDQNSIDVFHTVYRMRLHRVNMVQTEAQYSFLYKCVLKHYLDLRGQSQNWPTIESRLDAREDIPDVINGTLAGSRQANLLPVEPTNSSILEEEEEVESLYELDDDEDNTK